MAKETKQVFMRHTPDLKFVALTPDEGGLSLTTLIQALVKVQTELGLAKADRLVPIFEDKESQCSWTIQSVTYDKDWVRLA